MSTNLTELDLKKYENWAYPRFEQIKEYIPGDDFRTINWRLQQEKASDELENQYQDEKSQPIYAIIDTGRVIENAFNGLKLRRLLP